MNSDECRLKSLFVRGLDGDQTAYREFLSKLGLLLCEYVRHRLAQLNRVDTDVEDIVQEALLAIHNRRHTYDREIPVTAWAHAIARYKMIDCLRASERRRKDISLDEVSLCIGTDGTRMATAMDVRTLVEALPNRLRMSIQYMKLGGYSAAETAARTGMTEAAVKANVHRGLKSLSRIFRGS